MEGAKEAPPAPGHMEDSTANPSLETGSGGHPCALALNTDHGSDSKLGSS